MATIPVDIIGRKLVDDIRKKKLSFNSCTNFGNYSRFVDSTADFRHFLQSPYISRILQQPENYIIDP